MPPQSLNLLPGLANLPAIPDGPSGPRRSFQDHIAGLVSRDNILHAAELTSAASTGLWTIFDDINVDDSLAAAYQGQYPGLAADHSLHEHWLEMMDRGPESVEGFMIGLKGKLAEFQAQDQLAAAGWTNLSIASDPTQAVWDISGINPEGVETLIQVKTGAADYAYEVQDLISENPDLHFAVSAEIYNRIAASAPEYLGQMTELGPDYLLIEGTEDGLSTLTDNLGIDIPDGIGDMLPYAGAIIAGARLIHSVITTEQQFKAADRTTRNKIQVVQTLTLMSRMGINTVLAMVGGAAGTAAGSAVPLVGNLVGGIAGSIAGAGVGMYLNQHLQPHMLDLALDITGLEQDDLFYYKNKERIDVLAFSFREKAQALPSR